MSTDSITPPSVATPARPIVRPRPAAEWDSPLRAGEDLLDHIGDPIAIFIDYANGSDRLFAGTLFAVIDRRSNAKLYQSTLVLEGTTVSIDWSDIAAARYRVL